MKDKDNKHDNPDDVVIESDADLDDSVVSEESAQETIKKLREKLKKAVAEKQEYLDGWQRARADYTNFKKASEKEREDLIKFANEGLIEELIPILESFEMAWANKAAWEKVDKNWRAGIEYIYNQFVSVLASRGVKILDPIGEMFDPTVHEASEYVSVEKESDDHKIASVVQKGYSLNGKVLRPAKVKVGEYKIN